MYIALVLIMLFFQIWSGGKFFKPSNITNLFNQAAYVAVLAIGMTLILILKHIDLSVGYVAGFTGAIAAILMQTHGVNQWLAILIVLLIGLLIGLYQPRPAPSSSARRASCPFARALSPTSPTAPAIIWRPLSSVSLPWLWSSTPR